MWKKLVSWWRKRHRQTDMQILWPYFVDLATDLDHAKAGFAHHVFHDTAWAGEFTHDDLIEFISQLEPESRDYL